MQWHSDVMVLLYTLKKRITAITLTPSITSAILTAISNARPPNDVPVNVNFVMPACF